MGGNLNKLEVNLRENTYLGKDPQNYVKERKKKYTKPQIPFGSLKEQLSSIDGDKREKQRREGKTPARISRSVFCQHGQKGEDSKESFHCHPT